MRKFIFISRNKKERYQYFYDYERKGLIKEDLVPKKNGKEIPIASILIISFSSRRTIEKILSPIFTPVLEKMVDAIPIPLSVVIVAIGGLLYGEYCCKKRYRKLSQEKIVYYKDTEHNEDKVWDSYRMQKNTFLILYIFSSIIMLMAFIIGNYYGMGVSLIGIFLMMHMVPMILRISNPFSKSRDEAIELVNRIKKKGLE